jgi:hypothetical protein
MNSIEYVLYYLLSIWGIYSIYILQQVIATNTIPQDCDSPRAHVSAVFIGSVLVLGGMFVAMVLIPYLILR